MKKLRLPPLQLVSTFCRAVLLAALCFVTYIDIVENVILHEYALYILFTLLFITFSLGLLPVEKQGK